MSTFNPPYGGGESIDVGSFLPKVGGETTNCAETSYAATISGTYTVNLANGLNQVLTLSAATEITLPDVPALALAKEFILQIFCETYAVTWAASPAVKWGNALSATPVALTTGTGKLNGLVFEPIKKPSGATPTDWLATVWAKEA